MNRDVEEVMLVLSRPNVQQDVSAVRRSLQKLLALSNGGKDVTGVMSHVAKVLPVQDVLVKKLACLLLLRLSLGMGDVGLLVQNTLRQDVEDPNPLVRTLALKTMMHGGSTSNTQQENVEGEEQGEEKDEGRWLPLEGAEGLLGAGLDDPSPYVRRSAALLCVRHLRGGGGDADHGHLLVDRLYSALRDSDPLVLSNALLALDELLAESAGEGGGGGGGVVINRSIAQHLLSRLPTLTPWGAVHVLRLLALRFVPKSQEEAFGLLDAVDPFLTGSHEGVSQSGHGIGGRGGVGGASAALFVECVRFFLRVLGQPKLFHGDQSSSSSAVKKLKRDLFARASPRFATLLLNAQPTEPERTYLLLAFLRDEWMTSKDALLVPMAARKTLRRTLFCRYADPPNIKVIKMELSSKLLCCRPEAEAGGEGEEKETEAEVERLVEELSMYAMDHSSPTCVSRAAIDAIGRMAKATPTAHATCIHQLTRLLPLHHDHVIDALYNMDLRCVLQNERSGTGSGSGNLEDALRQCFVRLHSPTSVCAFLRLLGKHGQFIAEAPYFLKELLDRYSSCGSLKPEEEVEEGEMEVLHCLLQAANRLFLKRPAECQSVLGRVFELCHTVGARDEDLADSVRFYYGLLRRDVTLAAYIILDDVNE